MEILVWVGAALAALGVAGVAWSALIVVRARREGLADEALRARVARALPLNLGSLLLSFLGLMAVIVGVILA